MVIARFFQDRRRGAGKVPMIVAYLDVANAISRRFSGKESLNQSLSTPSLGAVTGLGVIVEGKPSNIPS